MKINIESDPPTVFEIELNQKRFISRLTYLGIVAALSMIYMVGTSQLFMPSATETSDTLHGMSMIVCSISVISFLILLGWDRYGGRNPYQPISSDQLEAVEYFTNHSDSIKNYVAQVQAQRRSLVLIEFRILSNKFRKDKGLDKQSLKGFFADSLAKILAFLTVLFI